jgi:hypothetical protein
MTRPNRLLAFVLSSTPLPEEANNAVDVFEGYSFDKKHQLGVCLYTRAKHLHLDKEHAFLAPEPAPFIEKPNACKLLEDPNQRDSFMAHYQNETNVLWFDAKSDPVLDYDGAPEKEAGVAWCEFYCQWSPAGSYLATLVPSKDLSFAYGTGRVTQFISTRRGFMLEVLSQLATGVNSLPLETYTGVML